MIKNLFSNLPSQLPEEQLAVLADGGTTRIERIVSTGHSCPRNFWYCQEQDEWVIVLRGAAQLMFDDGAIVELRPGDYLTLPAGKRHRVHWTTEEEPTVWLAVFYDATI